ncbi:MAG: DUF4258 domain-containing protein, partial [Vicinamibacterales bacterium]
IQFMDRADVLMSLHATQRCFERGITPDEVFGILITGRVILRQRLTAPRPSETRLGWVTRKAADGRDERRPVHVVSVDDGAGKIIVITVYWPDADRWNDDFTERRQ